MTTYTPYKSVRWPGKDEKRLPENQRMLPMWPEQTTYWERIKRIGKRREYMFVNDWIAYLPCLSSWCVIRANFVHDWASIPRLMQATTSADGIFAGAAPFHDFGYRFSGLYLSDKIDTPFVFTPMSRLELDQMFLHHNIWINGLPGSDEAAYLALRAFGAMNYGQMDIEKADWSKPVVAV